MASRTGLSSIGLEREEGEKAMEGSADKPLRGIVPLLQVGSMPDTLTYYQQVLGFSVDFRWPSEGPTKWAMVSRPQVRFMFTIDLGTSTRPFIAERGNGVVFYVLTDDVEALYAECVERGALVVQDVVEFGGRKQFSVADLNGYVIAFSEPFA